MLALGEAAVAIGVGTALALGASALVLGPLLHGAPPEPDAEPLSAAERTAQEQSSAIEALREIEFDRATGKLSEADYGALKTSYTRAALAELRARDAAGAPAVPVAPATVVAAEPVLVGAAGLDGGTDDDAVESALRAYRARAARCPVHGARPEPDARFCTECGRFLAGRCATCGAACEAPGQRFCTDCGTTLAA